MTHLQTSRTAYKFLNNACLTATHTNISTIDRRLNNNSSQVADKKPNLSQGYLKNKLVDFLSKVEMRNMLVLSILILAFSYLYRGRATQSVKSKISIENNKTTADEGANISPLMVPDKYMLQ